MRTSSVKNTVRLPRLTLVMAALLAMATMMIAAPGARAGTSGRCGDGAVCLWEHKEFGGGFFASYGSDSTLWNNYFHNTNIPVANQASTAFNNGQPHAYVDVRFFDNVDYKGDLGSWCLPRDGWNDRLDWIEDGRGTWNDRISSFAWVSSC